MRVIFIVEEYDYTDSVIHKAFNSENAAKEYIKTAKHELYNDSPFQIHKVELV